MKWFDNHRIGLIFTGFITVIALSGIELAKGATVAVGPGVDYDFDVIQAGIDAANYGDTVLVAPGEYVITEPITFRGKAITVVSEAGPDKTTIRMGTPTDPERGSVVIFENNETVASVLEGFTITGARKGSWFPSESGWGGGGISFYASSGTVKNCAIVQNSTENGGGVIIYSAPSVTIANCIIKENTAVVSTGGVFCMLNSFATMTDCIVTGNTAETNTCGGVKCWQNSSLDLTNCIISGNSTFSYGGGAECWGNSKLSLMNCTITGNSAGSEGGGVFCGQGSVTVTNSTIWGNEAPGGPEISAWGGARYSLEYSNIAGGQAEVDVQSGSTINWDVGNIDADPHFAELGYWADINDPNIIVEPGDPNAVWVDGDYHLKSEAGRWEPYSESWVMDDVTSPCIDRGDPNSPVCDEPDPNDDRINMGAYGGTPEASMSIGQLPPLPPPKPLAHWKLDEIEGGIAHDSAGVNDGILYGGPLWQPTAGQIDGALAFDGIDDYVETDFVLNPRDVAFSVFAWIKGGAPGQAVLSQIGGASWLLADASDGKLMTGLVPPAGGRSVPRPLVSEIVVIDNQWHLIGFVWDGAIRSLYVDSVEVAKDAQAKLEGSDGGLYIGTGKAMETDTFFSGLIDDVRIYNRVVIP